MNADFLWIRRMKQGDEEAFDLFVRKYYEEILRYCNYHCSDQRYAEDLTQETFVRFFSKLSDYHDRGKTKNYLYTIAGNLCRDFYKKKREVPLEELEPGRKPEPAETGSEEILNKLTVEWALGQLPDELREVVILYYFQDLKLREIADTLQIGLSLVKYRLKQAKEQMGRLLGKEEAL